MNAAPGGWSRVEVETAVEVEERSRADALWRRRIYAGAVDYSFSVRVAPLLPV
jgi:hypothetical protein